MTQFGVRTSSVSMDPESLIRRKIRHLKSQLNQVKHDESRARTELRFHQARIGVLEEKLKSSAEFRKTLRTQKKELKKKLRNQRKPAASIDLTEGICQGKVDVGAATCPVCRSQGDQWNRPFALSPCGHVICCKCWKELQHHYYGQCPVCRDESRSITPLFFS